MRCFLFGLFLFLPFLASAQEKGSARTFRVLYLNPPPDAPQKIQVFDGSSCQEITLPQANFSDVYKLTEGPKTLTFVKAPVTKPEEIPAGSPSAKIGEAITDFYLIVGADPSNKILPVSMQVIDATGEKFRKGQMMWYNLTPVSVGGQLGSQKLAMKGQSRAVVDPPAAGSEQYDVSLSYVVPGETEFRPICQTKWIHDSRSRMLVFVYGGENKKIPKVAGFSDYREPEKKVN